MSFFRLTTNKTIRRLSKASGCPVVCCQSFSWLFCVFMVFPSFRGVSEMGGGNVRTVDLAHIRIPAAGCDDLYWDRVTGEGMREVNADHSVEPFCEPGGSVVEHQFVGVFSGD